ncbi:hypothetical protein AMTRI_Chr01g130700 [Amborella trichopoda]
MFIPSSLCVSNNHSLVLAFANGGCIYTRNKLHGSQASLKPFSLFSPSLHLSLCSLRTCWRQFFFFAFRIREWHPCLERIKVSYGLDFLYFFCFFHIQLS